MGGGAGDRAPHPAPAGGPYLDVLGEAVEHLFSDRHSLGKVPLALLLNDILAGVVPVEVADGLLGGRQGVKGCWANQGPAAPEPGHTWMASRPHLQPQKVVHRADDDVNGGCVPCLCS